jgi:predicted TIM-barrel fold metal-dependent hydrolase
MEPMWHPVWERLWKAVSDVQLPLHFHTFPAMPASVRASLTGDLRRKAQFTNVAGFQMNLINIIAAIIGAGVLERYPNLRIGLGESGIGWLPYALDRMDFEFEDRFRDLMKLKPSEYWRRQCRATFQYDRIGARHVDDIGVETLMWGSDYLHPDGVWPEASKYIEEQFAGLSPEEIHKITCENAAKFCGLNQLTLRPATPPAAKRLPAPYTLPEGRRESVPGGLRTAPAHHRRRPGCGPAPSPDREPRRHVGAIDRDLHLLKLSRLRQC